MKQTQCVVKHVTENGEINYKVWGLSLAEKWKLNIVFKGTYDKCIKEQGKLTKQL